jgi:CRISPR-associated protein Csd2
MQVLKVVWWQHSSKAGQYSSARVHGSLRAILQPDGSFDAGALKSALHGLESEVIDGF